MAEELLNPRGAFRYEKKPLALRRGDLKNMVLGLIDNSKQNADLFLDRVLEVLSSTFTGADILRIRKATGSVPAPFPPEFLERCQLVINAFGD